ncbi:hypothetical protein EJ07DRAFT_160343 [Lizonia empirigonia]|nr:hypothetical protein EJ07DRAFT_160343 [Lizonia empirigonia]
MYAVRLFGNFFGNLSELRPLHEKALDKLGQDRFACNYRRVLKLYVLRLQRQTSIRTRTEDVTVRILRSRQNRMDIVRNIIRALGPEEMDLSKPQDMLDYRPPEKESIAEWIKKNHLEGANDSDVGTLQGQGLNKQHGDDSTMDIDRDSDSDCDSDCDDGEQEKQTTGSLPNEEDDFETNLLSVIANAYDFLRRDIPTLDMELRLLVLPPSLRDVMEFVPRDDIQISAANDVSFVNRAKALVEDNTSMEWDWWPLKPRIPDLELGRQRLEWHLSWRTFYQEISSADAVAIREILVRMNSHPSRCYCCAAQTSSYDAILCLKNIFQSFPSWIAGKFYSLYPSPTSSAAQRRYTPPTTTATRTASVAAQGIGLTPMSPAQLNNSGNTTSTQATGPICVPPVLTHKWLWIIFGIKNHPDFHAIENIEMSSLLMSDATFFRELKSLESKHRWPILK